MIIDLTYEIHSYDLDGVVYLLSRSNFVIPAAMDYLST
jgi:hypothetical protein